MLSITNFVCFMLVVGVFGGYAFVTFWYISDHMCIFHDIFWDILYRSWVLHDTVGI